VETTIGVFAAREGAEMGVKRLLDEGVPPESVLFLTRSENESRVVANQLGATVGGFMGGAAGLTAGVAAATLLVVPGLGQVFALGLGGAALLGLLGAGTGAAVAQAASTEPNLPQPTPEEKCSEDTAFFREVLQAGRSLIVVRTESKEIAATASALLDQLGIGMQGSTPAKMQTATREVEGIVVVDISGRITHGEGNARLRDVIRELLDKGNRQIVLNLGEVHYVDSSGVGELVHTHTSVRNQGGQLKLANLQKRLYDLLQMTRLHSVFDVERDEASAVQSFRNNPPTRAVA